VVEVLAGRHLDGELGRVARPPCIGSGAQAQRAGAVVRPLAPAIDEDEEVAGEGIVAQLLRHERAEAVEAIPQIHGRTIRGHATWRVEPITPPLAAP
jgi:hypothetical protein